MQPYQERFINEFHELQNRIYKLKSMLDNWDHLEFEPTCSYDLLHAQLCAMVSYLDILKIRADIEKLEV